MNPSRVCIWLMCLHATTAYGQQQATIVRLRGSYVIPRRVQADSLSLSAVNDATLLGDGTAVVVDNSGHELVAIGPHGSWRAGARLKTPARTLFGSAIAADEKSVYVLDPQTPAVRVYDLAGQRLLERRTVPTEVGARAVCASRDNVFVLAPQPRGLVNRYASGIEVQTFPWPRKDNGAISSFAYASSGRLTCLPQRSLVIVASDVLPEVYALASDGTVRWAFKIPDFHQPPIRAYPDGSVVTSRSRLPVDLVHSVLPLSVDYVAVQVVRGGQRSNANWLLETFVVRAKDGVLEGRQTDIPSMTAAAKGRFLTVDPTTRDIKVYQFQLNGGRQ